MLYSKHAVEYHETMLEILLPTQKTSAGPNRLVAHGVGGAARQLSLVSFGKLDCDSCCPHQVVPELR